MNRNLDGCYFRIQRDGKWQNLCFTDLTPQERESIMEGRDAQWLRSLCNHLADCIVTIGEEFDLKGAM